MSNPQPGDLVFYASPIHHVALDTGDGTVLHAPRTGSRVRIGTVAGARGSRVSGAVRRS